MFLFCGPFFSVVESTIHKLGVEFLGKKEGAELLLREELGGKAVRRPGRAAWRRIMGELLGEELGERLGEEFVELLGEELGERLGEELGELLGESMGDILCCFFLFCTLRLNSTNTLILASIL